MSPIGQADRAGQRRGMRKRSFDAIGSGMSGIGGQPTGGFWSQAPGCRR